MNLFQIEQQIQIHKKAIGQAVPGEIHGNNKEVVSQLINI